MHLQGKREDEPVLGAGKFFTVGMSAPAKRLHRRKRGVRTSNLLATYTPVFGC